MSFIIQGKTNWKFLLIIIVLAVMVGMGALLVSKKEIPSIKIVLPKTQKEISEQEVLELENQILDSKFGSKITEFTIIKKIPTPSLESCPGVKDYTQNKVWFSEGFPDIKGFRDYAIEGFIGINGEFICLYANRRGAGSGTPPLIPIDSFYDQVTTADWKTYRNEKNVYEVKYYKDWIYKEAGPYTYFFPEIYEDIQLSAIKAQVFIWNENLNQPKEGRTLNMEENLCVDGCPPEIIYSVKNNSKIAILKLTIQKEVCGNMKCAEQRSVYSLSDSEIENIIHQMLSTFRFIENYGGIITTEDPSDSIKVQISSAILPKEFLEFKIDGSYAPPNYEKTTKYIKTMYLKDGIIIYSGTNPSRSLGYQYFLYTANPRKELTDYVPIPTDIYKCNLPSTENETLEKELVKKPDLNLVEGDEYYKVYSYEDGFFPFFADNKDSPLECSGEPNNIQGEIIKWSENGKDFLISYGNESMMSGNPRITYNYFINFQKTE